MKNALIVAGAIALAAIVFFFIRVAGFYQKIYSPKSTVVKKPLLKRMRITFSFWVMAAATTTGHILPIR